MSACSSSSDWPWVLPRSSRLLVIRIRHSLAVLSRFILSEEHMLRLFYARQARSLVIAFCLVGIGLLSGCGSSDSGSDASGTESPRMKQFEEIKAKNAKAKNTKR